MTQASAVLPFDHHTLNENISKYRWFHQIDFGDGIVSPGLISNAILRKLANLFFGAGIAGKTVLDIGCWDGFFSIEAARRGASRVMATDHFAWSNQCWGDRGAFDLARSALAPDIEVLDIDLADLSVERIGTFDIVLFSGVFYHLRNPLLVLDQIAPLAKETFILETHMDASKEKRPAMIFYPGRELNGDPTNWWGPNRPCVEAMLKNAGFSAIQYDRHPVSGPPRRFFPKEAGRGIFRASRTA